VRTVSAREANQAFSTLLGQAAGGEEIVITRRGKPVAVLSPWKPPEVSPEKQAAIEEICRMMREAPAIGARHFTRDEMHERDNLLRFEHPDLRLGQQSE
jgi:prevent-host-death family protein